MACNENVIKNMASEVTRNCQAQGVNVDTGFVVYLIEFLLLNPKYGKLFSKTLNRNNLEYFVNECVAMITRGETSLNTLKMQFVIESNYDKLQNLVDRHLDNIDNCLKPLVNEILDSDPDSDDINEFTKLYRKISIYIVLASGLGNPGFILTLKEGMAALESVFSLDELQEFTTLPRADKLSKLKELLAVVSGVRLFNRDCKKAGEGIPDLPFNLIDAGKACLSTLSHSLISVMQRVNLLTTAVDDVIGIEDETGNIYIDIPPNSDLTLDNFEQIFDLLSFNRQYEMYIRRLLSDIESTVQSGTYQVDRFRVVLEEIHEAVKYKEAVPVVTVFPLFTKVWEVWRTMQNIQYLISTVTRLMSILMNIKDHTKIPLAIVEKMLQGKPVITDQERMSIRVSIEDRLSLASLKNYVAYNDSFSTINTRERHIQYLGFCTICLTVGALVPSNMKLGLIKYKGSRYGFCGVKMAARFSKDPSRYINEVLDYARNNPQIVNLLGIMEEVRAVKDVDTLVVKYMPKILVSDKDVQTEIHPVETHVEKHYTWDLWEWKRRACQWASIVNCQTHSTQTNYSHMRSEIHCQTFEPRDKCLQTKRDAGMNTNTCQFFLWGLRGQKGDVQHMLDLVPPHSPEKAIDLERQMFEEYKFCDSSCLFKPTDSNDPEDVDEGYRTKEVITSKWPCTTGLGLGSDSVSLYSDSEEVIAPVGASDFYIPTGGKKPELFRNESRMVKQVKME